MFFEIHSNYTIEDFYAFWRGFRWKEAGRKPPSQVSRPVRRRIAYLMFLAGVVLTVAAWLLRDVFNPAFRYLGLGCLVVGAAAVVWGAPQYPHWVERNWRRYRQRGQLMRFSFTEDSFEVHTPTSDHRYDYALIRELWEDEGHYYVGLNVQYRYVLRKDSFSAGWPDVFAAFLTEKTGKPVRWLNGDRPQSDKERAR